MDSDKVAPFSRHSVEERQRHKTAQNYYYPRMYVKCKWYDVYVTNYWKPIKITLLIKSQIIVRMARVLQPVLAQLLQHVALSAPS